MVEIWKDIINFEGEYKVSSFGRILSCKRFVNSRWGSRNKIVHEKILKPTKDKYGYLKIFLGKKNHFSIHRLVAQTFIENLENKPQVNHKNCIKSDNRVENLEWVTVSENTKHAYANNLIKKLNGEKNHFSKLKKEEVLKIRELFKTGNFLHKDLAKKFNISRTSITNIINNKYWNHEQA